MWFKFQSKKLINIFISYTTDLAKIITPNWNCLQKISQPKMAGLDLSFWSAVMKSYPFATLFWVNKNEIMKTLSETIYS